MGFQFARVGNGASNENPTTIGDEMAKTMFAEEIQIGMTLAIGEEKVVVIDKVYNKYNQVVISFVRRPVADATEICKLIVDESFMLALP